MCRLFFVLFSAAFTVHAQPSISVKNVSASTLELSWPSSDSDFSLQQTTSLSGIPDWQDVDLVPVLNGAKFVVPVKPLSVAQFFRLREPLLATIANTSPFNGEEDVAVTRESIVRFTTALQTNTVLATDKFYAFSAGRRILSRVELSSDRRRASLFYLEPLPGSARVDVFLDPSGLSDSIGRPVDSTPFGLDHNIFSFQTLSLSPLPNTVVIGTVYASELVPGPDTGTNTVDRPLAGVTITVDGMEQSLRAVTDAQGKFILSPVPPGRFFVHIDGRTIRDDASGIRYPDLAYYPFVGKAWEAVAGKQDNFAGGSGKIYLPLITQGTLQQVSMTNNTTISFPPNVISSNPALAGVSITVPANSLFSDDGRRGGKVGIAPVPPDRLPGPLPPGLELPIVITVQTDGALNFDKPVPICFPNLANHITGKPWPPGTKGALISFSHKKGVWEDVGGMTVSTDGKFFCTDPGVGILQPGWHGPECPKPSGPPPKPCVTVAAKSIQYCSKPCKVDNEKLQECLGDCDNEFQKCVDAVQILVDSREKDCSNNHSGDDRKECLALAEQRRKEEVDQCRAKVPGCKVECKNCWSPFGPSSLVDRIATTRLSGEAQIRSMATASIRDQILALLQNVSDLIRPYVDNPHSMPDAVLTQIDSLFTQADQIAGGDAGTFLAQSVIEIERALAQSTNADPSTFEELPPYPVLYAAEVRRPKEMLYLRGKTEAYGQYSLFIPPDGELLSVSFYDPKTKRFDIIYPNRRPEAPYELPYFVLLPLAQDAVDSDHDGLPDEVEFVYGTDPNDADSDGDGIPDGAEIEQGTNPLDGRIAQTGVIATSPTTGPAIDVRVENDLVLTAEGAAGVSLFSAYNGSNPILISHVATGGTVQRVAFADDRALAAQPDKGLTIIDFATPSAPQLRNLPVAGAQALATDGSRAYIGSSFGNISIVDTESAAILGFFSVTNAVWDLALDHGYLYALTEDRLFAFSVNGASLLLTGSAPSPFTAAGSRRLSIGGGLAYAVHRSGYNPFDLSNPAQPLLLRPGETGQFGWRDLVPNGSGVGLAAVGSNSGDNEPRDVALYDLSNKTNIDVVITKLPTPGSAEAVVIHKALAYVADRSAGLQVVNYLPYDDKKVPPTVSLTAGFDTNNAATGRTVWLVANASDDVQVRNVELYQNDALILTDQSFPFEFHFTIPVLSSGNTFRLRARAYDTGGNSTWSEELVVKTVPDTAPPAIIATTPFGNGARTLTSVSAYFDKPLLPNTVSVASFKLYAAGPDGRTGTGDDVLVTATRAGYSSEPRVVTLSFDPLPFGKYRAVLTTAITDTFGNHLATDYTWAIEAADAIFWQSFGPGNWNDPANWQGGKAPTPSDNVIINVPTTVSIDNGLTIGKSVRGVPGALLALGIGATFDAAILDIDLLLYGSAKARIIHGFTFNGLLTMYGGLNNTQLNFDGTQTFDGTGTAFLTDPNWNTIQVQPTSGTLTIGPGLTIRGSGTVGRVDLGLISFGKIIADIAGSRIIVTGTNVVNLGTLASVDGGSIYPINLSNQGTIQLSNSPITLTGSFTRAALGTITGTNGTVSILGTLDNRGSTLAIDRSVNWQLSGGTIQGGTISVASGAQLLINYPGGTLDGVTLNGDLHLAGAARLHAANGLTLNGTATLDGNPNPTQFDFDGEQTLNGTGTILFTDSNSGTTLVQPTAGPLTIGPGVTIRGGGGTVGNPSEPLTILGTVSAETGGGTILLSASTLKSSGTLKASSGGRITTRDLQNTGTIAITGGASFVLDGAWTNRGAVEVSAALDLSGTFSADSLGTITSGPGATINLSGTYNNKGKTLLLDVSKASWLLSGGTIVGGKVQASDAIPLQIAGSGTLDGVALAGKLVLQESSKLTVRNGLTLNGSAILYGGINNTVIKFDGSQTMDGTVDILFVGPFSPIIQPLSGTLTFGQNVTIHGGNGVIGDPNLPLISLAKIVADGSRITIYGNPFTNSGTTEELNGGRILINP
jgi:hypothetical protein